MTRAAALAAALLLTACVPGMTTIAGAPHLGCTRGTHDPALGSGLYFGLDATDPIQALRGGTPLVCAARQPF